MTNNIRSELLQKLIELSAAFPEMRFGQLVANLSYLGREFSNEAIWEAEDNELLAGANQMLSDWERGGGLLSPVRPETVRTDLEPTTVH